ncbi:ATP-dependent RNA helicase DDX24 isoform 1 [Schistosoma japonicum]|uniref:ATP-dependent RNA helicase n=1 Tax=Schistosoma japonicum TaxID=6182 RepID=A0A4Z2CLL5_SCHJA|nr:ATP-dependent RNA helicase DDX24 isoform 1 [Schistosoma japonicum]
MFGLKKSAKIIDLSSNQPNNQLAANNSPLYQSTCPDGLSESRLLCPNQPCKDIRLFWFIAFGRHFTSNHSNQRCLIFLNSKSGVRRLAGVLRQLLSSGAFLVSGYPSPQYVNVLHADMIQKQRLRSLERFQADPNGILLASDVAARGLDLASSDVVNETTGVSWVIHFDVPRTAELYIHRSGRTARANRQGTSVLFISPNEIVLWRRIAVSLQRTNPELNDFSIQPTNIQLTVCEQIVNLAKQIDVEEHRNSRKIANDNWFTKAAKDANILLDDDYDDKSGDEENSGKLKFNIS